MVEFSVVILDGPTDWFNRVALYFTVAGTLAFLLNFLLGDYVDTINVFEVFYYMGYFDFGPFF